MMTDNSNGTAFGEHSERVLVDDGRSDAGEFITQMSARYSLTVMETMDFMSEVMEQMEQQSADGQRDHFWRRAMMCVFAFQGSRAFALECLILALGTATKQTVWFDIIGCRSQVELADRWKVTKANVEKCVGNIQDALCLSGERGQAARRNMSQARDAQLKKT